MPKKFAGFTPKQQFDLLTRMGYKGSSAQDDIDNFLAASPKAAASLGRYAQLAQQRVEGSPLSDTVAMAKGGPVDRNTPKRINRRLTNRQEDLTKADNKVRRTEGRLEATQARLDAAEEGSEEATKEAARLAELEGLLDTRTKDHTKATNRLGRTQQQFTTQQASAERDLLSGSLTDPSSVLAQAEAAQVGEGARDEGSIDKGTGITNQARTANIAGVKNIREADDPTVSDAASYKADKVSGKVQTLMGNLDPAQGEVTKSIEAAQGDPEALAQLDRQAAQAEAAQVAAVNPRELQPGEAIDGSAVDMQAAEAALQMEAAQANPSEQATVKGQLDELMTDFDDGATPTWAAGAMRAANAAMAARGLGASSMAGQAIIQATMEAAVPIAQADAQTYAQFDMANLSNRQQTVMFAAQERAKFLGQKFDQDFQSKVLNASKISEIANLNFTAEQQVAVENARLANSTNIANLNAENAKVLSDAAAMSQMDLTNLNNRQQAQVQNANNFLQMDLSNLNNRQQTSIFKAQQNTNALLSDQAATNAAKQFNSASENQTNQFFADLESSVSRFNAEQVNSTRQFNVSQTNQMRQFNNTMKSERDRFNAGNRLIIEQANSQWRQDIYSQEFQAQHETNLENARSYNNLTSDQLDQLWQRERDIMAFAFTGGQNEQDRNIQLMLGDQDAALYQQQLDAEDSRAKGALVASLMNFGGKAIGLW